MSAEQLTSWSIKRRELGPDQRRRLSQWLYSAAEATPLGSVLLQTCERVEWFALSTPPLLPPPCIPVRHRSGAHAVRHAFRVAAGLDSQLTGETQIVSQIRRTLDTAPHLDPELARLFRAAIRTGRRARSRSKLDSQITSYARLAANLAAGCGSRVGVLGTGALARDVLRSLGALDVRVILLFGSHAERARRLAHSFGARAYSRAELPAAAADLDCLITCIASQSPIELVNGLPRATQLRIVDLGEPVNTYLGFIGTRHPSMVTLDDLAMARRPRSDMVELAERIAEEGVKVFLSRSDAARIARRAGFIASASPFDFKGALA